MLDLWAASSCLICPSSSQCDFSCSILDVSTAQTSHCWFGLTCSLAIQLFHSLKSLAFNVVCGYLQHIVEVIDVFPFTLFELEELSLLMRQDFLHQLHHCPVQMNVFPVHSSRLYIIELLPCIKLIFCNERNHQLFQLKTCARGSFRVHIPRRQLNQGPPFCCGSFQLILNICN